MRLSRICLGGGSIENTCKYFPEIVLDLDFCTLLDARRPNLLEDWYSIACCIRSATLRARCKVLTWQELSLCLPASLQRFLSVKYGIVPVG
jgi:hypothetical protein